MSLNPTLLRQQIKQVLAPLGLYSADAEELLMATCAQESMLGTYRRQVGGPALGIFQMEPEDYHDAWTNYLPYHPDLSRAISALGQSPTLPGTPPAVTELVDNDELAIAMCRVHYDRAPGALPSASDLSGLWSYYKRFYNTPQGAATAGEFYQHYQLTGGNAK